MVQSLKCSSFHTREITLPNCNENDPKDCTRVYHIVLPRILCHSGIRRLGEDAPGENEYFEGHHKRVGTLPLVFALHAFEEDARSMEVFIPYADASHFVLVLPEGKDFSFNAGDCCGAAKHDDIDDVKYLAHLKQELTQEFSFLHPSLTFGIGFNNGAFMLTYASQQIPSLFKAIVPIAGYTHRLNEMVNADVGMMLHYSLDDTQTRPSGCCDNPNLPECNGQVMSDWCVSILQFFDLWAKEVAQCSTNDATGGFDNHIVSNNDGMEYSFSYLDNSTVFALTPDTNNPEKVDKLFETKLPMKQTYNDEEKGVTCLTATSPSCVANSTLCLYTKQGDFRPNFANSFFMYDEVMNYIANDACEIDGGKMVSVPKSSKRVCACEITPDEEVEYGGTFCFDALNEDGTFKPREIAPTEQPFSMPVPHQTRSYVFLGLFATMFTVIVLTIRRLKKRRAVIRKNSDPDMYDHCDQYSPKYRDFGRKDTEKVSNIKKHDADILLNDSEHSEHASPFRYRDKIRDTANDHLGTSEWDESDQSPYLFNIIKATEMAEVKRHSEVERGDSLENLDRLDDSYLEEHQPPWEVCPQEKMPVVKEKRKTKGARRSKNSLSTSLMSVINSPTSYLDSADRRLLRGYRKQQKEDDVNRAIVGGVKNALIRKNSEQGRSSPSTDTEGAVSIRTSADASLAGDEASLSNDLEQIESFMGTIT